MTDVPVVAKIGEYKTPKAFTSFKATERFLPEARGDLVSPPAASQSTKYMPPRIAFVGPRRVGKDTAGAVFGGFGYAHASFIRPVKLMMERLLQHQGVRWDVIAKMTEGDFKEKPSASLGGVTPRFFMQRMGIFMRETFGEDFFIGALARNIAMQDPYAEVPFFLTDCRFPDEAEALVNNGWVIVRIERPGLPQDETDKYVTETAHEAIKADHTLVNNFATAEEFSEYVEKWAKEQGLIRS